MSVLTMLLAANFWLVGLVQDPKQEISKEAEQGTSQEAATIASEGLKFVPRSTDMNMDMVLSNFSVKLDLGTAGEMEGLLILEGQDAGKPQFGVHVRRADDTLRKHLKIKSGVGLVVESVVPESGAAAAGVQIDDILIKLDDQWLINSEQFTTLVYNAELGQAVKATLVREGLTQEILVTLTERVVQKDDIAISMSSVVFSPILGDAPSDDFHKNLPEASNCSDCHQTNNKMRRLIYEPIQISNEGDGEVKVEQDNDKK